MSSLRKRGGKPSHLEIAGLGSKLALVPPSERIGDLPGQGRSVFVLDPLTFEERRAVSERIRHDITAAAADLLRTEQETKRRLNSVHIKCISLMIVSGVAIGYGMIYLRVMLVPFILAIFFMFLLEPLLFTMLNPPGALRRVFPRFADLAQQVEQARLAMQRHQDSGATPGQEGCMDGSKFFIKHTMWKVWGLFTVICCILLLILAVSIIIYMIVEAIATFPLAKYARSDRARAFMNYFPSMAGNDPEELNLEKFMPWLLQGPLFDALDWTFSIISQTFLTLLFLAFLLANDVFAVGDEDDFLGIGKKVRTSVRRYIRIKSLVALIVAVLNGLVYAFMAVDLWFLLAFLTFLLCYIPHVGNTIAVLAPLPLVFLDPTKTWTDLAIVFVAPFVVHQLASNLVEPKLLASSLDLHPIIVLLALAFWTTVWGAMGAILSVPLTAVARLVLLEVEHPYAIPLVRLLEGQFRPDTPQRSWSALEGLRDEAASPRSVAQAAAHAATHAAATAATHAAVIRRPVPQEQRAADVPTFASAAKSLNIQQLSDGECHDMDDIAAEASSIGPVGPSIAGLKASAPVGNDGGDATSI